MPPKYPFGRSQPSSSRNNNNNNNNTDDRPIVVSASGVAPNSPAVGLQADSPNTLRSRIPSPRNPLSGFSNETPSYPSPSQGRSRLLSLGKKKKKSIGGKGSGWMRVDTESPTKDTTPSPLAPRSAGNGVSFPKYDSRGYPIKDGQSSSPVPRSNGWGKKDNQGLYVSVEDGQGLFDSGSSTVGRVDGEDGRYYDENDPPPASYPPVMSYSMDQPSYSPYELYSGNGQGARTPSMYAESVRSHFSENSMTHFKKFDALDQNYSNFSITSRGGAGGGKRLNQLFELPADPSSWSYMGPEPDDDFHDPDIKLSKKTRLLSVRGLANIGCLVFLFVVLFMLFAGYPVLTYYLGATHMTTDGAYNLGGINSTGQIPTMGLYQLIDKDTPQSAYTMTSYETGDTWELIFSDEFNMEGRTFYGGDDPYWQAVDLHYWPTNNLEWYDPRMITTKNGSLIITLDKIPNHGLNYMGGMVTSWNQFCFTGGYVEASVSLPGTSDVYGLWPAIWSMGNLGRAAYGGTTDGLWPYSYDTCDVGTLPNQTLNGEPAITKYSGVAQYDGALSYLPGQRLSRCTCPDDPTHPGPKNSDGSWKGRSAPEIDMFEATVDSTTLVGEVSLSGQWAPYNPYYEFLNTSTEYYEIYEASDEVWLNPYKGGAFQQASSALAKTNQNCYTGDTGCYSIYGFEYGPGDDGYITWISSGNKAWTFRAAALGPNPEAQVGQRVVSEEPMYLLLNLGISENFGAIDFEGLMSLWPVHMAVDYVRVYQDPNQRNIGCDPPTMPTASYISLYPEAYSDPNITTFAQVPNAVKPKNSLVDTC